MLLARERDRSRIVPGAEVRRDEANRCRTVLNKPSEMEAGCALLWLRISVSASESGPPSARAASTLGKRAHDAIEGRLALKSDARPVGQSEIAVFEPGIVGKAAEFAEHARVGFRATETKARRNVERHLIAAVRKQRFSVPALALEQGESASIWTDAVGLRRIDLDDVAIGTQTAEAGEIADVLRREQVLAGRERRVI